MVIGTVSAGADSEMITIALRGAAQEGDVVPLPLVAVYEVHSGNALVVLDHAVGVARDEYRMRDPSWMNWCLVDCPNFRVQVIARFRRWFGLVRIPAAGDQVHFAVQN